MKKVYVFLAQGFELIEAMTPVDVLRRCGAEVQTVSVGEDLWLESSNGVLIKADIYLEEVDFGSADLLVLPGGYPGYVNLRESKFLAFQIGEYLKEEKKIAAICGAPTFFSYNHLLEGYRLTAHSSTKEDFQAFHYTAKAIERDRNLVTAIGAGHSLDFSFELAKELFSEEVIERVKGGMEL